MSRRSNSRFSQTTRPHGSDQVTIERNKIRHRQPNDMRIQAGDDGLSPSDPNQFPYSPMDEDQNEQTFWPDEGQAWAGEEGWSNREDDEWSPDQNEASSVDHQGWDDGADDDEWVFEGTPPEDPVAADDGDGIVWEDSDDIQFDDANAGSYDDDRFVGSEVELAGRRDVRPKAPRSPRQKPPATAAAQQTARRRAPFSPDEEIAPPPRQRRARLGPAGDRIERQAPIIEEPDDERPSGRFARTQATIGQSQDLSSPTQRPSPPPVNRRSSPRRRQAQALPAGTSYAGPSRRRRLPLMLLLLAALLISGGFAAYRELSGPGLVDGWQEIVGLAGQNRTAADTPFNQNLTPEEAVANLPSTSEDAPSAGVSTVDGLENNEGSQAGGPLDPQYDPIIGSRPPLPKFKPRFDEQDLKNLSRSVATRSNADNPTEDPTAVEPSLFDRLWNLLGLG